MRMNEIKNKAEAELQKILAESREKLRGLRFKDANRQLKDVREIRETKQSISRLLTELNSRRKAKENK